MTIEEKSKKLQEYCDKHKLCYGCKLWNTIGFDTLDVTGCTGRNGDIADDETIEKHYKILFDSNDENPEQPNNPYWDNICAIAQKQRNKGLETYGMGLEDNPMQILDRITYLEEELIDGLMYCEWIKDYLSKQEYDHET